TIGGMRWGAMMVLALGSAAPAAAQTMLQIPDVPGYTLQPTGDGGFALDEEAWEAHIAADGTVRFDDHWVFDLTDAYMRAAKQDPYRYAKARFLTATFELRTRMSQDSRTAARHDGLGTLEAELVETWGDAAEPAVRRRQALWEMWLEAGDGDDGR